MKKIISLILCFCMVMPFFLITAEAGCFPVITPDDYKIYVQQGKTAKINFTLGPQYRREKYHIRIYKAATGGAPVMVKAEELVHTKSGAVPITVEWDTKDVSAGIYRVDYYMSYCLGTDNWFEAPRDYAKTYQDIMIHVFKPGEKANKVLNTDIKAYIDGYPVRSYNIDGLTMIVAEDLKHYGFEVIYDNKERTLKIDDKKGKITSTYKHEKNTKPVGSKAMDVYYTDIRTYVKSKEYSRYIGVDGYNVNGLTLIQIDRLNQFGKVKWDPDTRTISFKRV